jgi:hypothetical protein
MKTIIAVVLVLVSAAVSAQVHVKGYTKKDGTYVAPHERTAPNGTINDNYSTKGNVNPYTGKEGTVQPEATQFQYAPPPPQPIARPQPTTQPSYDFQAKPDPAKPKPLGTY